MRNLHEQIVYEVHAYLIEGWWELVYTTLTASIVESFGKTTQVLRVVKDTIGIDDVRFVTSLESRKSSRKDVYVIGCRSMTREAQNAFLKVTEEPTQGTYFFLVVPFSHVLLPTLRSRLLKLIYQADAVSSELVGKFLSSTPAERLQLVEELIQEKDTAGTHVFLDALLADLYNRVSTREEKMELFKHIQEIIQARQYLMSQGSSLKLILEHVALVIPSDVKA